MIDQKLAEKVAHYTPDKRALASLHDVPIALIVAASGTGKNTVINRLIAKYPNDYHYALSHTTRAPRSNDGVMERNGVNYHFVDFRRAEQLLDDKRFVEVNWYTGNLYGLAVDEILAAHKAGKIAIDEIEVQGANDFAEQVPSSRAIFILPPHHEEWLRRLEKRYGDKKQAHADNVRSRIVTAKFELENALKREHFYLVVNDRLEAAVTDVDAIARMGHVDVAKQSQARQVAERLYQDIESYLEHAKEA